MTMTAAEANAWTNKTIDNFITGSNSFQTFMQEIDEAVKLGRFDVRVNITAHSNDENDGFVVNLKKVSGVFNTTFDTTDTKTERAWVCCELAPQNN